MKARNTIIAMLVAIILGQFFLLIRHTRIEQYIEDISRERLPVEAYVAGLTESVNLSRQAEIELIIQSKWAIRHLGQCIKLLEKERGLEPIPMKIGNYPITDSNHPAATPVLNKQESDPFYLPYEKPSSFNDPNGHKERDLNRLRVILNLNTFAVQSVSAAIEHQIHNYEERLQRLEPAYSLQADEAKK